MVDRRAFLIGGAATLAVAPLGGLAQGTRKPRIGFLTPGPNPREAPFWEGMRDLGYVEGKTIVVDRRSAEGDLSRLPALATEIVKNRPDLIVALVSSSAVAARQATSTIPIVVVAATDLVAAGLVGNLSHPGGNLTGTTSQSVAAVPKQVELVRQFFPAAKRVAALWDPINVISQQLRLGETLLAAARLHILVSLIEVHSRADLDRGFAAFGGDRPDALLVAGDTFAIVNAAHIAELSLRHRIPVIGGQRLLVEAGILASYGPDVVAISRRAATHVQKILNGAKAGDLAIELPTKFELVINMKTAAALGVTIPPAVLARADDVIR